MHSMSNSWLRKLNKTNFFLSCCYFYELSSPQVIPLHLSQLSQLGLKKIRARQSLLCEHGWEPLFTSQGFLFVLVSFLSECKHHSSENLFPKILFHKFIWRASHLFHFFSHVKGLGEYKVLNTASPAITGANCHRLQHDCPQRITPDLQNQAEKIKLEEFLTKLFEALAKYFHLIVILVPTFIKVKKKKKKQHQSLFIRILYNLSCLHYINMKKHMDLFLQSFLPWFNFLHQHKLNKKQSIRKSELLIFPKIPIQSLHFFCPRPGQKSKSHFLKNGELYKD